MKDHFYNEQNGLHYTSHGDVYLPDLVLPEKEYPPLGKYGRMRKTYVFVVKHTEKHRNIIAKTERGVNHGG